MYKALVEAGEIHQCPKITLTVLGGFKTTYNTLDPCLWQRDRLNRYEQQCPVERVQYMKFIESRTRCGKDLLVQLPLRLSGKIVDLGCGPGNSTELLIQRYPDSKISGMDSSSDMIRLAIERCPSIEFEVSDLRTYLPPDKDICLYFASMTFQWVPGNERIPIIKRLLEAQPPGARFAMCMPAPHGRLFHQAMVDIALDGPWRDILAAHKTTYDPAPAPSDLYNALKPLCSDIDIWHIDQQNHFQDHAEAAECFSSTGLRPFLEPLNEEWRIEFTNRYVNRLKLDYPAQEDGSALIGFPTLYAILMRQ